MKRLFLALGILGGTVASAPAKAHDDGYSEHLRYDIKGLAFAIRAESDLLFDLLAGHPEMDWTLSPVLHDLHRFKKSAEHFSDVLGQDYGDPTYEVEAFRDLIEDYNEFRASYPPGAKGPKDSLVSVHYEKLHQMMRLLVEVY
jgi:hypothetical protein